MQVGDLLKDNDPRMTYRAKLRITEVTATHVKAVEPSGRAFKYKLSRIHTDGKPRKSGLTHIAA